MIEIRPAEARDVKSFAMRPHEAFQFSLIDEPFEEIVVDSINKANSAQTALVDNVPAAIWGFSMGSVLGGAHLWMITSELVDSNQKAFLRTSRKVVQENVKLYGHLYGYVDEEFKTSARWMRWLGFRPVSRVSLGSINLIRFEISNGH